MICEGSCDTEASALHIKTEKCSNISQYYNLYCLFVQIKVALVNINDLLPKPYQFQTFEQYCKSKLNVMV